MACQPVGGAVTRAHGCHAVNCGTPVPPRMHMCRRHWAMVPRVVQRRLWATYRPRQEQTMTPSPDYLRAAAQCVRLVAEAEGQPAADIEADVARYVEWADRLEAEQAPVPDVLGRDVWEWGD